MTEDKAQFYLWFLKDNMNQVKAPNKWVNYIWVMDQYLLTQRTGQSIESKVMEFKEDKQFLYMKGCLPYAPLCKTMVILSRIPWFQEETRITGFKKWSQSGMQPVGPSLLTNVIQAKVISKFWQAAIDLCLWQTIPIANGRENDGSMTPSNTNWGQITCSSIPITRSNQDKLHFSHLEKVTLWKDTCPSDVLKTLGRIPSNFPGNLLQDPTHSFWTWCSGEVDEN